MATRKAPQVTLYRCGGCGRETLEGPPACAQFRSGVPHALPPAPSFPTPAWRSANAGDPYLDALETPGPEADASAGAEAEERPDELDEEAEGAEELDEE